MFELLGIHSFPLFVGAVLLLDITPGPDTAYIVGRSLAQGRGAGMLSVLGITVGCMVHSLACAFGLSALIAASDTAFTAIKYAGAVYLMYLGLRMLTSRGAAAPAGQTTPAPSAPGVAPFSARQLVTQGFVTNVLNPKVVLFFLSFFPQFVDAGSANKKSAFLVLGLVFVLISTAWNVLLVRVASSIASRMAGGSGVKRWLNRAVGAAFVGLGIKVALASR
ncbi:MAG: LysE family translocator [Pseudomonadota bacterium]